MPHAFARCYGASGWHLALMLGCFGMTAYCVSRLLDEPMVGLMVIWFAGVVLAHDLVLAPLIGIADRLLTGCSRWWRAGRALGVSAVNHVRVPILGSSLLFLMFFPGIVRQGTATHIAASGLDQQPYFARWVCISLAFVGISAVLYFVRLVRARLRGGSSDGAEPSSETSQAER